MRTSATRVMLALTFLVHSLPSFSQTTSCLPPTFLKTWGNANRVEEVSAMTRSSAGYLYLCGVIGSKTFIQKTTFAGEPLWVRAFEIDPLRPGRPTQIFEDSEGMIVGCGKQEGDAPHRGFVFRYDPVADSFLWVQTIESEDASVAGILEKSPGGNFVFYQNPYVGAAMMLPDRDMELLELDRATGNIVPGFAKRYGYLYIDKVEKLVAVNGSLYGIGTETCRHDYDYTGNRILLARFDPTEGMPLWAQLSDADTSALSDFAYPDLAVDGNALVAVYHVDDDATDWPDHLNPEYTHLQKTDLAGNILWVRRYGFSGGSGMKLLVVPDGYVLHDGGRVIKVNKNGDFLWGRSFHGNVGFIYAQSEAAIAADSLYLSGGIKKSSFPPDRDFYLWKMLADGSMSDSCGYVTAFNVQVTDVPNPVSMPITLSQYASPAVAYAADAPWTTETMAEKLLCPEYAPATVACPADLEVATGYGLGGAIVHYDLPAGSSGCACPGFDFTRTDGPGSGSLFPLGTTQVCYLAKDNCGSSASCCFAVKVREAAQEAACDTKTNGCLRYELLGITADAQQRYTYRIRVTNDCADALIYTAIQLPEGVTAVGPANLSDYVSPAGRHYAVRNPNFSPFYSIRFKSSGAGLADGASEVFAFTLPAQSQPLYFHISAHLESQLAYEAHLNTFHCPVVPGPSQNRSGSGAGAADNEVLFFPNPANGECFADLSRWQGQNLTIRMLDIRGQRLQSFELAAGGEAQPIAWGSQVPAGLYFMEIVTALGERVVSRLVVAR